MLPTVVVPLPRHVLDVACKEGGEAGKHGIAVAAAGAPACLDACCRDVGAEGLEARGQGMQLGERCKVAALAAAVKGVVHFHHALALGRGGSVRRTGLDV